MPFFISKSRHPTVKLVAWAGIAVTHVAISITPATLMCFDADLWPLNHYLMLLYYVSLSTLADTNNHPWCTTTISANTNILLVTWHNLSIFVLFACGKFHLKDCVMRCRRAYIIAIRFTLKNIAMHKLDTKNRDMIF